MRKDKIAAQKAVTRDLTAIALPTKLPLKKLISLLQDLTLTAIKTGNTGEIERVCQNQLLALLNANTEVAVLKGGRRGQLAAEKVIDEPVKEIMPIRFSLSDSGIEQAKGTSEYLQRVSGIDPTSAHSAIQRQNAELVNGLTQEIVDTIQKTIEDLQEQGVHVRGGKKEITNILLGAGIDPTAAPRLAETLFRTQSAVAYNAGRLNEANDPETAPYIWGFEYVTAHDKRVRPEHRLLEGVRLPKEDNFWNRYLPPNGWNCRCTILEIWKDEDIAKIDFGITGVDPRTRSDRELNLLPAFDGNVGILSSVVKNAPVPRIESPFEVASTTVPNLAPKNSAQYTTSDSSQKRVAANNSSMPVSTPAQKHDIAEQSPTTSQQDGESSAEALVYNIQPDIEQYNKKHIKKRKRSEACSVYVEPISRGREFAITDWKRSVVGRIRQKGISFATGEPIWRAEYLSERSDCNTILEALEFLMEHCAQRYDTTKDQILLVYKNKLLVAPDEKIIDDWKLFVANVKKTLRKIITSANQKILPSETKESIKQKEYVVEESAYSFSLFWKLISSVVSKGAIGYDRGSNKFVARVCDGKSIIHSNNIESIGRKLVSYAREKGIRYFSYDKELSVLSNHKSTDDFISTALNREFTGGNTQVEIYASDDMNDIYVGYGEKFYTITYNRLSNKMIVKQDNGDKIEIVMEDESAINLVYRLLQKIKKEQRGGIHTEVKLLSENTTISNIPGLIVKPYNDGALLKKLNKKTGESVTLDEVRTYINKLKPLCSITTKKKLTSKNCRRDKKTLERFGIQTHGNPQREAVQILNEVAEYLEENELSLSLRKFGVLPSNDTAAGRAYQGTRDVCLNFQSRIKARQRNARERSHGWTTGGNEYQTFIHEDTHQLMNDICDILGEKRISDAFKDIFATLGIGLYDTNDPLKNSPNVPWKGETLRSLQQHYLSNALVRNFNTRFTWDMVPKPSLTGEALDKWLFIDKLARNFSVYGASISGSGTTWQEACAEARADVICNGSNAKDFSKKVYAIILELYLEAKAKGVQE